MSSKLSVALIQSDLFWRKPKSNTKLFEKLINNYHKKIDLFILPEMFTTGFTMDPKDVAESMDGETINFIKKLSKKVNSAICGSIIIKDANCFYNRFIFIEPDGNIQFYDKRHTFNLVGEGDFYCSGSNSGLVKYKGWKILLRVCYDLRFPVWSRNTHDYDLLIYVANWPAPRINAWDNLLVSRAIENMSYCIGVNRLGKDKNNNYYPGHSSVIDLFGEKICDLKNLSGVYHSILDKEFIKTKRNELPFLDDADNFILK
ncbi:MAG: nitrilase family protein [Flavobacteriaceae bacterium]|nr:nitrilase family protein [Flavobacteriaceae bacterium]